MFNNLYPAVILDRPQMGENIGSAARIMANFSLNELRLVNPRDGWPNPKADIMASNAQHIIQATTIYDSFKDSIADCHLVYATTSRSRDLAKPVISPRQAATQAVADLKLGKKTAFIYGAERTGLENQEVSFADAIISIPVNPNYASLNIAQAVAVCAYEWQVAAAELLESQGKFEANIELAAKIEVEGLVEHLETTLANSGYYRSPKMREAMTFNLRSLLNRAHFTSQEVRTLRGIIRFLSR